MIDNLFEQFVDYKKEFYDQLSRKHFTDSPEEVQLEVLKTGHPYSKTLYKLLQEMHATLKDTLSNSGLEFPIIYGCDEYSGNIQKVEFDRSTWSRNTLVIFLMHTQSQICVTFRIL